VLPVRRTGKNNFAGNENQKSDGRILHLQNETRENFKIVLAAQVLHFLLKGLEAYGKIDTATANLEKRCVSDSLEATKTNF
jgi:hypothetical protein